MKQDLAEAGP